jgi:hypothetical protein
VKIAFRVADYHPDPLSRKNIQEFRTRQGVGGSKSGIPLGGSQSGLTGRGAGFRAGICCGQAGKFFWEFFLKCFLEIIFGTEKNLKNSVLAR